MQTFLPYPSVIESLKCLDYRRLGKQRVEAMQIHNILIGKSKSNAWKNHPAVKMWKDNPDALAYYHNECIKEWINRGYKNNMKFIKIPENIKMPSWFGNEIFHSSHRSNLLRKDKEYYSKYGWKEPDNLEYIWPSKTQINV